MQPKSAHQILLLALVCHSWSAFAADGVCGPEIISLLTNARVLKAGGVEVADRRDILQRISKMKSHPNIGYSIGESPMQRRAAVLDSSQKATPENIRSWREIAENDPNELVRMAANERIIQSHPLLSDLENVRPEVRSALLLDGDLYQNETVNVEVLQRLVDGRKFYPSLGRSNFEVIQGAKLLLRKYGPVSSRPSLSLAQQQATDTELRSKMTNHENLGYSTQQNSDERRRAVLDPAKTATPENIKSWRDIADTDPSEFVRIAARQRLDDVETRSRMSEHKQIGYSSAQNPTERRAAVLDPSKKATPKNLKSWREIAENDPNEIVRMAARQRIIESHPLLPDLKNVGKEVRDTLLLDTSLYANGKVNVANLQSLAAGTKHYTEFGTINLEVINAAKILLRKYGPVSSRPSLSFSRQKANQAKLQAKVTAHDNIGYFPMQNSEERRAAVLNPSLASTPENVSSWRDIAKNDPNAFVRLAAQQRLDDAKVRSKMSAHENIGYSPEQNPEMRRSAVLDPTKKATPENIKSWRDIAKSDPNEFVRMAAEQRLNSVGR
ncbi:MAG: hypothetical protein JST16_01155 [Bdellovibrionales bacterium]|nr:hypothetical protein [Bdellovibrionales bacterium]